MIFAAVAWGNREWWHGSGHLALAAAFWVMAVWLTKRTGHAPPADG